MDDAIVYNVIYKSTLTKDDIYAYIRAWKAGEIGFSVLEYISNRPDFSECSIFWMAPQNFLLAFEPVVATDEIDSNDDSEYTCLS